MCRPETLGVPAGPNTDAWSSYDLLIERSQNRCGSKVREPGSRERASPDRPEVWHPSDTKPLPRIDTLRTRAIPKASDCGPESYRTPPSRIDFPNQYRAGR